MTEHNEAMGYWQPRVMRHRAPDGLQTYAIHDIYFASDGEVRGYTLDALSMRTASVAQLKVALENLLRSEQDTFMLGDYSYEYDKEDVECWLRCIEEPPLDYASDEDSYSGHNGKT